MVSFREEVLDGAEVQRVVPPGTNFGAYLTRLTVATTGQVYRAEMACIETPAGGSTNINLVANASSIASNNDVVTNGSVIITGSTHSIGRHVFSLRGANLGDLADDYLYLAAGSGSSSQSYTAGKFIIKLYGCTF